MKLTTNATRMELLRLKKRLVLARRGHKLLKDKQDELMRQFLDIVESVKGLRKELETKFQESLKYFIQSRMEIPRDQIETALMIPGNRINVEVGKKQVLNLQVPILKSDMGETIQHYGFSETNGNFDISLKLFKKVFPQLLELAQTEKALFLMGDEIEKTRRRVNALEYVLIPELEETKRYIEMKLSEMERGNLTRLMKVKEMIR